MADLHIAKGFSLPLELVTSTQAILARRRSGKSYTASVEAEELLQQKQQVVVIDPTSAWHGLRSSADGEGVGFSIVVFGGDHSDAPLDFRAGKAMAAAVVEHGFSAIFDIGNLHTDEQIQFVMDFCSELLRISRTAIHVFMDEADTFAPQLTESSLQKKCLGTVSRLVKQGGIRGVGFTMITQRPADINKKVLSQVDILTVLRMSHPLDIKAATDWIKSEVTVDFAKTVEVALPSLPVGTAFFCSAPLGLGERVEVRARKTFNSGATPKPGERKVEPKVLAKVDIEKLGRDIAASVKRVQEESPEYLKRRIKELESSAPATPTVDEETMKMLKEKLEELSGQIGDIEANVKRYKGQLAKARQIAEQLVSTLSEEESEKLATAFLRPLEIEIRNTLAKSSVVISPRPSVQRKIATPPADGEPLSGPEQRILNALAWMESVGVDEPEQPAVAFLAGYTYGSGGYNNPRGRLRQRGLIEYIPGDHLKLSAAGKKSAEYPDIEPTNEALHSAILGKLPGPEGRILSVLLKHYPKSMDSTKLAEASGYTPGSGGFNNPRGRLKTLGLVEYPSPGMVVAKDLLFPEGR